jgi:predicted HTH transcriptional regulator
MRGRILRLISEKQNIPVKELPGQLKTSHDKIMKIIDQLCKEGFIKKNGRYIRMG